MEKALPGWHPDPAHIAQFRWWNGNEWTAHVYNAASAIPHDKSVGVAFVLTFFFGPLGLFYVSAPLAIAALVVDFLLLVFTLGLGLVLAWPTTIIVACIVAGWRHRQYERWLLSHLATTGDTSLA